jgi:hypothetical protein
MTPANKARVERACAVPIERALGAHKLRRVGRGLEGPCPRCGGTRRFGVDTKRNKQLWVCRHCGVGGDVIDLMMHVYGCSFIEACKRLTGEAPPGSNGAAAAAGFGSTQTTAAEREKLTQKLAQDRAEAAELDQRECERQRQKARWLWRQSELITGTIGETYFRNARGYRGVLPTTVRFLPARDGYPPAVIAAFGLTHEIAPGGWRLSPPMPFLASTSSSSSRTAATASATKR